LEKIKDMKYRENFNRHMKNTRIRLQDEFDQIWIKHNNNEATFEQWNKALDKWLNSERI